jgi:predicted nucleic acid-binding protein
MAVAVFLDTSVLLAGLVDLGPQSGPAQTIMHSVAEKAVQSPGTGWHCCLEFYSVATRLPPEYRLTPDDACQLLEEEVLARMAVHDLPPQDRAGMLRTALSDRISGGRIYDAHIAEIARAAGARLIVTDNRRHFLSALRYGLKVEAPAEYVVSLRKK